MSTKQSIQAVMIGVLGALSLANSSPGDEVAVVYPQKYTHVESPSGRGDVGRWERGRLQSVYAAEEFLKTLPDNYRTITSVRWRPDAAVSRPTTTINERVVVRLSTTDAKPGELSMRYADNSGDNETVVFDGTLTLSTQNIGPAGGPKEFDLAINFTTPFRYDPSDGNLLIDFIWYQPFSTVGADECSPADAALCQWVGHVGDPNAEFANSKASSIGIRQFIFSADPVTGDFNQNGQLDAEDFDLLAAEIRGNSVNPVFDLNLDTAVDASDRETWVIQLRGTYFGDSNLDGVFDSSDLINVFAAGKYESGETAGWAAGDWDGNGLFDSTDLIVAFADGGYEQGPRGAVAAVPEPGSFILLAVSLCGLAARQRSRNARSQSDGRVWVR
jgi:hypothetical protein